MTHKSCQNVQRPNHTLRHGCLQLFVAAVSPRVDGCQPLLNSSSWAAHCQTNNGSESNVPGVMLVCIRYHGEDCASPYRMPMLHCALHVERQSRPMPIKHHT